MNVCREAFGPDYTHLRQFLSHNRNIILTNGKDEIYIDGLLIDKLYSLNRFYRRSEDLAPSSERPSAMATAVVESASKDFKHAALFLFRHVDALCELIQFADLNELREDDDSSSQRIQGNVQKRQQRSQTSRAAKRARTSPS